MFILVVTNRILYQTLIYHLSPNVKMNILITVLHTFVMELVRRICVNIKRTYPWLISSNIILNHLNVWTRSDNKKRNISTRSNMQVMKNIGNDHQRQNDLMFKQILPANIIRNVWENSKENIHAGIGASKVNLKFSFHSRKQQGNGRTPAKSDVYNPIKALQL